MDRLTATLLCLGALSLAPIAHAQQHDMSQHDMSQHAMHGNDDAMKAMFDKADANHDGDLTRAEAHRLSIGTMSFEEMDRNFDGLVSRFEYEDSLR